MKLCSILYGQVRTLEECIPSIKRLFKDILNTDFYVILNISCDTNYKKFNLECIKELINNNLNPKKFIFIKNEDYSNFTNNININNIEDNITLKSISFEEYSKIKNKDDFYTVKELNEMNINLNDYKINKKSIVKYPFNLHIEDYMLYEILKFINDDYTHIFRLRTDVAWFENFESKKKYTQIIENGFRGGIKLKTEYNNIVKDLNFNFIKQKIYENIGNKIIISGFHNTMNTWLPSIHCGLYNYDNFIKWLNIINNTDELLIINKKYPILYPNWGGELLQKKIYEYYNIPINKNFTFHLYYSLIRINN